jgi:hypothetical protein
MLLMIVACGPAWRPYSPPTSDLVGNNVTLIGNEIVPVGKAMPNDVLPIIKSRIGVAKEKSVNDEDIKAGANVLYKQLSVNLGLDETDKVTINANNVMVDTLENWDQVPPGQTFVYAGMRAANAYIDITTNKSITIGKIEYKDLGDVTINVKSGNQYTVKITNPNVYYRVLLAKIKEIFSGVKYENYWVSEDAGDAPLDLNEANRNKTDTIQPYRHWWNRLFGGVDMPELSLMIDKGELFVRVLDSQGTPPISLKKCNNYENLIISNCRIHEYPVGDMEKKILFLDLKANRKALSIIVRDARIHYPEKRLEIVR